MRKNCIAQGLTEVLLVCIVIIVIAVVAITPYAQQMSNFIASSSPHKAGSAAFTPSYVSLNQANFNSMNFSNSSQLLSSYNTLANSSSSQDKSIASDFANVINNSANFSNASNSFINGVISSLNANGTANGSGTETSGSMANLLSSLSNAPEGGPNTSAVNNIVNQLDTKSVNLNMSSNLAIAANNAINELEGQIGNTLPRSVLLYGGASYTYTYTDSSGSHTMTIASVNDINSLSQSDFNSFFSQNFIISNPPGTNSVNNFTNSYLAVQNASSNYSYNLPRYNSFMRAVKSSLSVSSSQSGG